MTDEKQQLVEKIDWRGKRVLITGGTAGLGKSLAIQLANKGAEIMVIARGMDKLEEIAQHDNIHSFQADIGNKEDIHPIFLNSTGILGGIDVLINNASTLGPLPMRELLDNQCEGLEEVLQVNLLGPYRLTKLVLPKMILSGSGIVLNISSDAAINAYPTWGLYSISKTALDHMSRIFGEETGEWGVKFLAVDPGDMNTKMHMDAIPNADPSELYQPENVAEQLIKFLELNTFDKVRYTADEWRDLI